MNEPPRLTAAQEREFLKEANIKVDSLRETISDLEEILDRKRDAVAFWERRQKLFSSLVRLRAKRKTFPDL